MIKGIVFGSLSAVADFTDLERQAFNRAAKDHGVSLDWSHGGYRALMRSDGRFPSLDRVTRIAAQDDPLPFLQNVEGHFRDLLDEVDVEPSEWFLEVQADARRKGLRLALVTGAFRQTTLRALSNVFRSRASHMFDVVTAAEDETAQKPDPALFDLALERLGVAASNALAFETSDDGISAAHAAGLYSVALPGFAVSQTGLTLADTHGAPSLADAIKAHRKRRGPVGVMQGLTRRRTPHTQAMA